jgi:purine-nucleoside phosphorylase
MSEPFSQKLIKMMEEIALENNIQIHKGIYAAMPGPCLETRAEYRFLRTIGADALGMSTVPETIVANQLGMQVAGISIFTDECYPECLQSLTLEEIIATANSAEPKLSIIFKELIRRI